MNRWQLLVPVKGTTRAKTRLGDAFGPHRPRVALAFARDTVEAALGCDAVAGVTVTTGDPAAVAAFADSGARVFEDQDSTNLNVAISLAAQGVPQLRGASHVAVLLGDLPALRSTALGRALELADEKLSSFVPDAHGSGTTLLCAHGASVLQPHFGFASARAHAAVGAVALRDAGLVSLRRDVDDVDDLLAALQLGVGEHTAKLLREIGWTHSEAGQMADDSLLLDHIGGR